MVEGGSELIHLFLGDALGISCEDLGLHLIDGSGDSCQQQLPSDTDMLPRRRTSNQLGQGSFSASRAGSTQGLVHRFARLILSIVIIIIIIPNPILTSVGSP